MTTYRTGNHWGVTIVATEAIHGLTGDGLPTLREEDHLVAVVVNGDQELAERICALLNGEISARRVLMDIVDPEPCRFDHHGYCQEHGWLQDGVCPHYRAKELL